jgi:hypothetical protein
MTVENDAYDQAVKLVDRARVENAEELVFPRDKFENLTELPSSISQLHNLKRLDLSKTSISRLPVTGFAKSLEELDVSTGVIRQFEWFDSIRNIKKIWLSNNKALEDISALTFCHSLTGLDLDATFVSNLKPIATLSSLTTLRLSKTPVWDLRPLERLVEIDRLDLTDTQVLELRPLLNLRKLMHSPSGPGLTFANCKAAQNDSTIAEIAAIPDAKERAGTLFHYLETGQYVPLAVNSATPNIPERRPAPLETEIVEGRMVRAGSVDLSPPDAMQRAEMGWQALQAYTDSFAVSFSIDNYAPLPGILRAFQDALGQAFDPKNQVAIGVFGSRVIRLSQNQDFMHSLPTGADTDLQGLAAQIALYTERFPDWNSYQTEAAAAPAAMERVAEEVQAFSDLSDSLTESAQTDQDVAEEFARELHIATGPEADEDSATALVASTRETLRTLGEDALIGAKGKQLVRDSLADMDGVADTEWAKLKFWSGGWTLVLLKRNEQPLRRLAVRFPERLGWIAPILDYLCGQPEDQDRSDIR